jgi:hypothetical protein
MRVAVAHHDRKSMIYVLREVAVSDAVHDARSWPIQQHVDMSDSGRRL